jgi:hypothetical protein
MEEHVNIDDLRKEVKLKGCIEVSYRWITKFATHTKPPKTSNVENPSTPEDEGPMPRRQLPMIGTIPEKALKGDTQSHQAMYALETLHKTAYTNTGIAWESLEPRKYRPGLDHLTSMWTESPSASYGSNIALEVRGIDGWLLGSLCTEYYYRYPSL